ncbi:O-antigen ligase family protein [Virgibacillus sp. MG-45]|uniref:O-antigen ligase family protein n=1 Tax=Virgibacillus sp. MG-45 TaxID=3102791 RepID=UPI002ED872C5
MKEIDGANNHRFIFLLSLLLIINTFVRTQYETLITIGNISIFVTLIVMFAYVMHYFVHTKSLLDANDSLIHIAIAMYLIVYTISYYSSANVDFIYFLKLSLFFVFILGAVKLRWTPKHIRIFAHLIGIVTLILFLHWVSLDFSQLRFKSIFRNPNYLGVLLLTMLYFKIIAIKYSSRIERFYFLSLIMINLLVMYSTNSRSPVLALIVILIVWILLKKKVKILPYLFLIVITLNSFFILIYIWLQQTSLGIFLNKLSIEYLGKSLYSGRSILWEKIIQKIMEKPLWGYGVGIQPRELMDVRLTAHNQYLQILLEVGILGFLLFLFLIFVIWNALLKNMTSFTARWSLSFFIGFLIYENFELTLFQNNYSIAMLQWVIITVGINFIEDNKT